jgi:hypothetical protein
MVALGQHQLAQQEQQLELVPIPVATAELLVT